MPLTVDRYRVLLTLNPDSEPSEHVVAVIHGDRMRAELEAPKHGLASVEGAAMNFMGLWLWAACLREHVLTDVPFKDFIDKHLLNFEEVEDPPQFPGSPVIPDAMGPTTEEDTASPSSSPESSETSAAGSTPPPTPA